MNYSSLPLNWGNVIEWPRNLIDMKKNVMFVSLHLVIKNEFNVQLKSARTSKGFLGKMIRESSFRKTSKEFLRKMVRIFFPSDIERFSSKNGKHLLSSLVTVSINREIVYVLIISLRKNKETSHALFAVHANRNLSKLQTAFKYTWILKNLWL